MSDIKMKGAADCSASLSWGGQTYEADADAVFTVPVEAYADLIQSGFVAVGSAADAVAVAPAVAVPAAITGSTPL